jgi:hypothetical protein
MRATLAGFVDFQRGTVAWTTDRLGAAGPLTGARSPDDLSNRRRWLKSQGRRLRPELDIRRRRRNRSGPEGTLQPCYGEQLRALWRERVDRGRANVARAFADGDVRQLAKRAKPGEEPPSLRWILSQMIRDYGRHKRSR